MGHYAGTLYIDSEKVKLIEDCLENKRLFAWMLLNCIFLLHLNISVMVLTTK